MQNYNLVNSHKIDKFDLNELEDDLDGWKDDFIGYKYKKNLKNPTKSIL